ncbi:transcription antitermination factor NusB [Actinomycetaceae bacterium L2_0104]
MMAQRSGGWHPGRQASDPARLVAYDVLRAVDVDGAYANLALPQAIRRARLSGQDAAYATNLCYGTLRLRGRWDAIIARCTQGRSIEDIDPEILDILRLGTHQLLEFQTPPHAAIFEMVTLTRNELSQNRGGFVNAILRRVSERADEWERILRSNAASDSSFYATWYSHPRWVVEELEKSLVANGRSAQDLPAVLEADNEPAKVALVPRDLTKRQLRRGIIAEGLESAPGYLMPQALLLESGDPQRLWAIQRGEAGVQDEGSQLIAALLAAAPITGPDELWLDLCSGPGGKTATLAALGAERGVSIHANEPLEHRLDLVANAVEPWAQSVALRLGDGRDIAQEEAATYDRVLVDAPCTGLGALRRRPEARWRKSPEDVEDLRVLQLELLQAGFEALRPGGALVYSTCSPVIAETRGVVESFLESNPNASLRDAGPIASGVAVREVGSHEGYIQLWPDLDQTDAMFIALIAKER